MACHDVKDDAHAPDVRHLRDVRLAHQYLRCRVRVTAAVRFAAFELAFHRKHVRPGEAEVDQLDVVLFVVADTRYQDTNNNGGEFQLFKQAMVDSRLRPQCAI